MVWLFGERKRGRTVEKRSSHNQETKTVAEQLKTRNVEYRKAVRMTRAEMK